MNDVFIILAVFSVPLAAIIGRTVIKYRQLELQHGGPKGEVEQRLHALEQENRQLKARVETLETIATGMDSRTAGLDAAQKLRELEAHVEVARDKR